MTFNGDRNLGTLTLPRMHEGTVKVLDINGVPVYRATSAEAAHWERTGATPATC